MIALLQRVLHAEVKINNQTVASIKQGLLVFIGLERNDSQFQADKLLARLLAYRIFADDNDKMNLSLHDMNTGLLLVPQFTLAADTSKGLRPSFSPAAPANEAEKLFDYFCQQAKQYHALVETGQFGADMQISLTNDGPVTFCLHSPPLTD